MSLLSQVSKGRLSKPHRVLIYGPDGVGKSTFAADAPNPIFIGSEDGTSNLDVVRFPRLKSLNDVASAVSELITTPHEYKTLVIDSLDWLEPMVWEKVCKDNNKSSIEEVGGGYGKGYVEANQEWRALMNQLVDLQEKTKMNLVVIAHAQIKTFTDPIKNASYDRYVLKLNEKASALWREFVDSVLFTNFEVFVKNPEDRKAKAYGDGARYIYTERRPAWDAKNRMGLPFQMPLSWADYDSSTKNGKNSENIRQNIITLVSEVENKELAKRVMDATERAGNNSEQLDKILNRLTAILEAK